MLRAIGRQISDSRDEAIRAELDAVPDHGGGETTPLQPPDPLHGYQVIEVTVSAASPAAGARLGTIAWPPGTTPVAVLHDHTRSDADPAITLHPGDQVSLLTPAPATPDHPAPPATRQTPETGDTRPPGPSPAAEVT